MRRSNSKCLFWNEYSHKPTREKERQREYELCLVFCFDGKNINIYWSCCLFSESEWPEHTTNRTFGWPLWPISEHGNHHLIVRSDVINGTTINKFLDNRIGTINFWYSNISGVTIRIRRARVKRLARMHGIADIMFSVDLIFPKINPKWLTLKIACAGRLK